MSHVAGLCSAPIVAEARARGFDVAALVAGTGESIATFEDPRGRVEWSSFVPFASHATKMLGEDVIRDLASRATVDAVPAPIRRILPRLTDSRPLFHLAPRWWGPWIFHGTHGVCETLPDGRLREIVKIRPEHQACPEFFSGLTGTLRAIPRLTGQADALVDVEHDGREAEFLITPPPRVRFRDRFRRRPAKDVEELGFAREALLTERRSLHLVAAELDRAERQRTTLQEMSSLLLEERSSNFEVMLEGLVELLLRRDEIVGARLSFLGADGTSEPIVEGGRRTGLPDRAVPLMIGRSREIGHLSLWAALEGDDLTGIAEIESWLAFALEFGRAKVLNAQLRALLDENVFEWQEMEARLERLVDQLDLPTD